MACHRTVDKPLSESKLSLHPDACTHHLALLSWYENQVSIFTTYHSNAWSTYTQQNKGSNTSPGWIMRHEDLLEWSQHRIYYMYTLKFCTMYIRYVPNSNPAKLWKIKGPNIEHNLLCYINIWSKSLSFFKSYTRIGSKCACDPKHGYRMFELTNRY